ncbi:MAG: maltokinase N-terminal cap-like domain-containing protein [Solirubrobacteraceae bacterium]
MSERVQITAEEIRRALDEEELREWVQHQRWYASKARSVTGIDIVESITLRDEPPLLLALVQTRFATGTHELYQLPLALRGADEDGVPGGESIAHTDEWTVYDALADPTQALELLRRIEADDEITTADGHFSFHQFAESGNGLGQSTEVRLMGVEQSNSSLVFDDSVVLKVFRKLEPGVNPELEILRFLTWRGFPNIAPLHGWYDYEGQAFASTLGVAQTFLPDAIDGWELALDELWSAPAMFLERLGSLGTVTAEMHTVLASEAGDPAFSPEEPSQEALGLLMATIDEDIERIFLRLPDDERLAPIAGRGQDVRERLAARAQIGVTGRVIRTHGDYHLGQTLHTPRGWVIIDFEGEPGRPLPERRQKRSPLRDVASMLRSFAYVTSAIEILRNRRAPAEFEERAREKFLEHYFASVDPILMPGGEAVINNLLSIYELEKAIYELRYELNNRPDWISIPVAGIGRILEGS